jgi:uncharacterized linocin/CFP29 family protein
MKGEGLDVTAGRAAARAVAEKLEDVLFNGSTVAIGGNAIPGLTTFTARSTHTISTAWPSVTNTSTIVDDVLAMITLANADNYYGPFVLFVPGGWSTVLAEDYDTSTTTTSQTVRQRLMGIEEIDDIVVVDKLATPNVVLVQATSDVVDLAIAEDVTTVEWDVDPMVTHFKVMAAIVHRLKQNNAGGSGIVHGS